MIQLKQISKHYMNGNKVITAIDKMSLVCDAGEFLLVTGASGSGKSTLLNILSGVDYATSGEYYLNGTDTDSFDDEEWRSYRSCNIGLIYQDFKLIDTYTAEENIALAVSLFYNEKEDIKQETSRLIELVGISEFAYRPVCLLSGGQKQRVAIARALAGDKVFLLADEPTANLDEENAVDIIELLKKLSEDRLIVVVTHDEQLFENVCTRKVVLEDGKIVKDTKSEIDTEIGAKDIASCKSLNKKRGLYGVQKQFKSLIKVFCSLLTVMIFCLGLYSICLNNISGYEEGVIGTDYFRNISSERYVITKNDHTPFTEQDYNNIKSQYDIKYLVQEDIALDIAVYLTGPNIHKKMEFYLYPFSMMEGEIINGRVPNKTNEVAIFGGTGTPLLGMESPEEWFEIDADGALSFGVNIVGWGTDTSHYISSMYVSDEIFTQLYMEAYTRYCEIEFGDKNAPSIEGILFDKEVPRGTVFFVGDQSELNNKESVSLKNNQAKLTLSDMKMDKISSYPVIADKYENFSNYIIVNEEDYKNVLEENYYQISVFSDEHLESWENYNVIYPHVINQVQSNSDDILQNIFWFAFCLVLSLVIIFITCIFLSRSVNNEVQNAYVRALLGYAEDDIYKFFFVRLITVTVLACVAVFMLRLVCANISMNERFYNDFIIFSNIPIVHLIVMTFSISTFLMVYLFKYIIKKSKQLVGYGGGEVVG